MIISVNSSGQARISCSPPFVCRCLQRHAAHAARLRSRRQTVPTTLGMHRDKLGNNAFAASVPYRQYAHSTVRARLQQVRQQRQTQHSSEHLCEAHQPLSPLEHRFNLIGNTSLSLARLRACLQCGAAAAANTTGKPQTGDADDTARRPEAASAADC